MIPSIKSNIKNLAEQLFGFGVLAVGLLAFGLFIQLLFLGSPAAPCLAAAIVIYLLLSGRESLLFHAARDTLKPVILGLSIATVWISLVRIWRPNNQFIEVFEECLTTIAIRLETFSRIGPIWYGCTLVLLALLSSLLQNRRLSQIGKPLKKAVDFSMVSLMTAASFTFFSQLPIEIRIHDDWDLEAKYQGWPPERSNEQRRGERYLLIRLNKQITSLTREGAQQFRTQLKDIREEEQHPLRMFNMPNVLNPKRPPFPSSPRYASATLAYPDFDRKEPVLEKVVYYGILAMPLQTVDRATSASGPSGVPVSELKLPDHDENARSTNRDLLIALNNSFCDAIAGATGKLLGSESNISIRFLKAVVELGAERLIEKHFIPASESTKPPPDIKALLSPETYVERRSDPWLDKFPGRPEVLAFGFRADLQNALIDRIIERDGIPSDVIVDGDVTEKAAKRRAGGKVRDPVKSYRIK